MFTPVSYLKKSATFDITIFVEESVSEIHFTVYYKTSLFESSTIRYFMTEYTELLKQIIKNPKEKLGNYQILGKAGVQIRIIELKLKIKLPPYKYGGMALSELKQN